MIPWVARSARSALGGQWAQGIVGGFDADHAPVLQPEAEAHDRGDAAAKLHPADAQPAAGAAPLEAAEQRRERAFRECSASGVVAALVVPASMVERARPGRA